MKLLLLSFLVIFAMTDAYAKERQLTIVGNFYPPHSYIENDEFKGIDVDTIRTVFKKLGIKPLFKLRPWARALAEVKSGESDAIFPLFKTKERNVFLEYPTEPLSYEKNILVVSGDSKRTAKTIEDIKGWGIGVAAENSYGETFDEYQDIERLEATNNERLVLQLNAKNRIDAIIINELVFDTIVSNYIKTGKIKRANFRKLEYVPNNAPLFIGFSKTSGINHELLAKKFSDAMKQLKEEGVLKNIIVH
ncbi:substrate-binding periplasmic protein [Cocleimonas flava]|uniref:Polar amino acid transport system substrate-binding protein n=1 Tax=Cocleimonas flava TaxID=634765 RepID=A0A4R1EWK9_9GAMM|nr:transporter substrate-binding domain-containing protein [Cocleimonas flava]TCJ85170.1 polar amino acid transport system substrate-binding protein [Cocleimonas flava]